MTPQIRTWVTFETTSSFLWEVPEALPAVPAANLALPSAVPPFNREVCIEGPGLRGVVGEAPATAKKEMAPLGLGHSLYGLDRQVTRARQKTLLLTREPGPRCAVCTGPGCRDGEYRKAQSQGQCRAICPAPSWPSDRHRDDGHLLLKFPRIRATGHHVMLITAPSLLPTLSGSLAVPGFVPVLAGTNM